MSISLWLLLMSWLTVNDATSSECHNILNTSVEWYFHGLPDCSEDYLNWSTYSSKKVTNVLACAKRCAENDKCLSFYVRAYEDQLFCGEVNIRVRSCSQLTYYPGAKFYLKSDSSCLSPWRLALHQSSGYVSSGSLTYLIKMIEQGSQVRILIQKTTSTVDTSHEATLYNVDSLWVSNTTVTAHMFTWTFDERLGEALWTKVQAKSSGEVFESYYENYVNESNADMLWFVKETDVKCGLESAVVLEVLPNGTTAQGSLHNLKTVMEEGFSIRVVERRSSDESRSFQVSRVTLDSDGRFQLSGVWLDAFPDSPNDEVFTSEMVTIVTQPTFSFNVFYDFNIMNDSSLGMRQDRNVSFLLAADYCWEKVLATVGFGNMEFGSVSNLAKYVRFGSDIRVVYHCNNPHAATTSRTRALSIDRVKVDKTNTRLVAYSVQTHADSPAGTSIVWEWAEVFANGTVFEITYFHDSETVTKESCQASVSWFVNTRRRGTGWFFHEENGVNAEYYSAFPKERMAEGWMPRLVSQITRETDFSVSSRSHKVTVRQDTDETFLALDVDYGYSDGKHWNVSFRDSRHFVRQVQIDLVSTPSSVGTVSRVKPFWMDWFF